MPAPSRNFVALNSVKYDLKPPDRSRGEKTFEEFFATRHLSRQDVDGSIGEQNLDREQWAWTFTDWSGGEGALVHSPESRGAPPHFWKTEGGIDTRISGQFKMSPIAEVISGSGSSTTIEGNTLATDAGTPTATGSNVEIDALNESVRTGDRTPGAVAVTVAFRLVDINKYGSSDAVLTIRCRVRNETDMTNTDSSYTVPNNTQSGSQTITINYTGIAGKNYRYYVTCTAFDTDAGLAVVNFEVDHIKEETGTLTNDTRALVLGYNEKPFAYHWDGTNTDIFVWDQVNGDWDSVAANVDNSQPIAATNSDKFQYLLVADRVIFQGTDAAAAQTTYTAAPASTVAGGITVAGNRLYQLLFGASRQLGEITLDGAGTFSSGSANWKVVMTTTDFPDEESADTTLRQRITSIGNGVRFFVNSRGGTSQVYEFSEGAGRPLRHAALGGGYTMTAVAHNQGITWIAATYSGSGDDPAKDRTALYYIGADEVLRLAVEFRPDDPNENRISYIAFDQHHVYCQQGSHAWRYDPTLGSHVMDTHFGSTGELGRGIAVLDNKKWAAFSGEGPFVTQDSYPIDQTIYLYSPAWHYGTMSEKVLTKFDVITAPLPANTIVSVEYETDYSGTWTSVGTITTDNATFSTITVSSSSSTVSFRVLRYRIGLSSSDGVDTPTIRAATAWARLSPDDNDHRFRMVLNLDDDLSGSHLPFRQLTGKQKADNLRTAATSGNILSFVDHYSSSRPGDTDSYNVVIDGLEFSYAEKGDLNQHRWGEAVVELVVIE